MKSVLFIISLGGDGGGDADNEGGGAIRFWDQFLLLTPEFSVNLGC